MAGSLSVPATAQQQVPGFRADVDMVLLNVAVINTKDGDVPPLSDDDFRVYDDGVAQEIVQFLSPRDAPLDVGLILDSSTSMTPVASTARRAALTFLGLLEADDCAYVLPFTDFVGRGRWGKAGDPTLWSYIQRITVGGGTSLYDAVLAGLAELERTAVDELATRATDEKVAAADQGRPAASPTQASDLPSSGKPPAAGPRTSHPAEGGRSLSNQVDTVVFDVTQQSSRPVAGKCGAPLPIPDPGDPGSVRRRALVVLSDGADENSETGFDAGLAVARIASVPVFTVALGYANEDPKLKARLSLLSRATGGRVIESFSPDKLRESYTNVVALLRSSYLLGYYPRTAPVAAQYGKAKKRLPAPQGVHPKGLRWHEVRVELRRPNFKPLVRPGYYR